MSQIPPNLISKLPPNPDPPITIYDYSGPPKTFPIVPLAQLVASTITASTSTSTIVTANGQVVTAQNVTEDDLIAMQIPVDATITIAAMMVTVLDADGFPLAINHPAMSAAFNEVLSLSKASNTISGDITTSRAHFIYDPTVNGGVNANAYTDDITSIHYNIPSTKGKKKRYTIVMNV